MRLGLQSVATFVPDERYSFLENQNLMHEWDINSEFLKKKTGFLKVARKPKQYSSSDLAHRAFIQLQKSTPLDPSTIEMIAVVTQNPDCRIPHVSSILQDKIGAPETCAAFDISHGCAGYVYGLAITLAFMKEQGMRTGLLFTSDPYSEIVDPLDRDTALLFGDASSVTLLSDSPVWECGKFSFQTDGKLRETLTLKNEKLRMDGLSVFNFAAKRIPLEIQKVLKLNSFNIEDIDSFLIHSGSRYIVDTIARRAGLPIEKVPFADENIGNTVSTSIPLLLEKEFSKARTLLLSGFGVGLSSASTVLRRAKL